MPEGANVALHSLSNNKGAPKWTMQARRPSQSRSTTPGPGAYGPGPVSTKGAAKPTGPSFGFGTSTRLGPRREPGPGPGAYGAPGGHGAQDPRKEEPKSYVFGSSKRGAGYSSTAPGPGSYQPSTALTRPESPCWSSGGGRGRDQLHLRNLNPGPGAYSTAASDRAFSQPDKIAQPAWGFGSSARSRVGRAASPGPGAYDQRPVTPTGPQYTMRSRPQSGVAGLGVGGSPPDSHACSMVTMTQFT